MSVKRCTLVLLGVLIAALGRAETFAPDKFTARTAAMTPDGVELRFHIREWSSDESRAAVVAALAEAEAQKSLQGLPTLGHVWQSGSPVGYAVKYAHRTSTPNGERVTFVTDRALGSYELEPWTTETPGQTALPYSVIELYLDSDANGTGTFSLAADVAVDEAAALVTLAADAPRLLADAKLEPKPYWAKKE